MTISGINFPLTIDPTKGNLITATDGDLFQGHILSWLMTQPFERVMVTDYGMEDQLFENVSSMSVIVASVLDGLTKYVPDVTFQVIGYIDDAGEAIITVYWEYNDVADSVSIAIS